MLCKNKLNCAFCKLKVCGNPASSSSMAAIFLFAHFVSLCHISGNSCNISNFFIIAVFVRLIYDWWSFKKILFVKNHLLWSVISDVNCCKKITTHWRLRRWLAFFSKSILSFWLCCVSCRILVSQSEVGSTAIKAPNSNQWTPREFPREKVFLN